MNAKNKSLIIVFLTALSLRLILFLAVGSWQDEALRDRIIISDAFQYHRFILTEVILFISIMAYFALASAPISLTERYRGPIMPYIILLSSYGTVEIWRALRERKKAAQESAARSQTANSRIS